MTIELREFQNKKVRQITEAIDSIERNDIHDANDSANSRITLKSPTGTGKTVMMASIVQRRLSDPADPHIVILLSPGAGQLETQTKDRLNEYFTGSAIDARIIDQSAVNSTLQPGHVYVSNWEKLIKRDRNGELSNMLTRDSEIGNLQRAVTQTARTGVRFVIFIDESHYGKGQHDVKESRISQLLNDIQSWIVSSDAPNPIIIEMSATPIKREKGSAYNFEVTYREAREARLMRKQIIRNDADRGGMRKSVVKTGDTLNAENILLDGAFRRMEQLDADYEHAGSKYHALTGVVVPNSKSGNDAIDRVTGYYESKGITRESGQLVVYTSDIKDVDNVRGIAAPDSPVRVLIYKQALALGWDCPRAQILVGFRHIKSVIFSTQNMGRFLRTTEHDYYDENDPRADELNYAYVYDNSDANDITSDPDSVVREDSGIISEFLPLNANAQAFVNELNGHHLPKSYIRRSNQSTLTASQLDAIVRSKWELTDISDDIIERHDIIASGVLNTEDMDSSDTGFSRSASLTARSSNASINDAIFGRIENILVHDAPGIPDKIITTRAIISRLNSLIVRDDRLPGITSLSDAPLAILANIETIVDMLSQELSESGLIQAMNRRRNHDDDNDEDDDFIPDNAKNEQSIIYGHDDNVLHFGGVIHIPERAIQVPSKLADTAIYASDEGAAGYIAMYPESGERSGPEKKFEEYLLGLEQESNGRYRMRHWLKNPPYASQSASMSMGISIVYHALKRLTNWFLDYMIGIEDTRSGRIIPVAIEIKGREGTGEFGATEINDAKELAAEQYTDHTGLPVAVFHEDGNGQFTRHGSTQSFIGFLDEHADTEIHTFEKGDDLSWMMLLGKAEPSDDAK